METASSVAAPRGGSLQNSPTPSRKDRRAVSDLQNVGDASDYVNGREQDGFSNSEMLQQQLVDVSRRKGELQQLEIELRAQMIAKHEIMEIQSNYESQFTEYANAAARMQEQLHEKERSIREAERKLEEKERELHAIKLDNEAAWANEDILREQNKELATFRRERDHSEAERTQNIHKISELQEHIQEKERQLSEFQEQNRIAQETILYKDEQLREAQGWMARAQEMDALQSSTNHSLQTELRERTEQYNQLWHGCQRQFAEMERLHLHTVQQLQLELTNVREGGGSKTNSCGASQIVQNSVNHETHGNRTESAYANVHSNGKSADNISSLTSSDDNANQGVSDSSQMPMQNHVHLSQGVHGFVSSDVKSNYQVPANGQSFGQGYGGVHNSQGAQYGSITPSSFVNEQAMESGNEDYHGSNDSDNNFQDISSQFRDVLRLNSHDKNHKPEEANGQVSPGEDNGVKSTVPETLVSSGKHEKNLESALLDERSLLTCILRTIPAGGRIRISSTLPNRLGKMLAPLHWHDYRKKYGKLDDFVARHLELFVIEDDYIQVREGAQKLVAASAAAAKVAAAAAASSSPNSVYVAMTPMAQSQELKKNNKTILRGRQSSDYIAMQQRKL